MLVQVVTLCERKADKFSRETSNEYSQLLFPHTLRMPLDPIDLLGSVLSPQDLGVNRFGYPNHGGRYSGFLVSIPHAWRAIWMAKAPRISWFLASANPASRISHECIFWSVNLHTLRVPFRFIGCNPLQKSPSRNSLHKCDVVCHPVISWELFLTTWQICELVVWLDSRLCDEKCKPSLNGLSGWTIESRNDLRWVPLKQSCWDIFYYRFPENPDT